MKKLAVQGVLTYCTTRTLPYHLYADECELLVFGASLPSVGFIKNRSLIGTKRAGFPLLFLFVWFSCAGSTSYFIFSVTVLVCT